MTIFNGSTLAAGWLSVAVAASKDAARPALDRTISIEAYPTGVRLVATDSYVLLRSWVPNIEHDLDPEPEMDEAPYATGVAMDPHGRAKGFLAHVLRLAKEADGAPVEIRLNLGVVDTVDDDDVSSFEGMEARYVVLELPDNERLKLGTYEGEYPHWRKVLTDFSPVRTDAIALNPEIIGRLAKLGKFNGNSPIGWRFGGANKMAFVEVLDAHPAVVGAVMPVRWDFDLNAPREDDTPAPDEESDA